MDHTLALPDDLLASILRRLLPRGLAASRCVCKAWLAVVDTHGLLLLPHVLPHSVRGLYLNYVDHRRPHFFARPSAQPAINYSLAFLRHYRIGYDTVLDHCNGLLLCDGFCWRKLCVVNPATRRWEELPWEDDNANPHIVFDPAASRHYQVFSIPRAPKKVVVQDDYSTASSRGEQEDTHDLMEWLPSLWTLNVFSSRTRQWQMTSFVREGEAVGTMADARLDPLEPITSCWGKYGGPRRRYGVYLQGSLYVHCHGAFVVRLSLSDCKYQVIKALMDIENPKHA
ncbi:hypothetical protein ACQ4PT_059332 [Festuca glaucescens]